MHVSANSAALGFKQISHSQIQHMAFMTTAFGNKINLGRAGNQLAPNTSHPALNLNSSDCPTFYNPLTLHH